MGFFGNGANGDRFEIFLGDLEIPFALVETKGKGEDQEVTVHKPFAVNDGDISEELVALADALRQNPTAENFVHEEVVDPPDYLVERFKAIDVMAVVTTKGFLVPFGKVFLQELIIGEQEGNRISRILNINSSLWLELGKNHWLTAYFDEEQGWSLVSDFEPPKQTVRLANRIDSHRQMFDGQEAAITEQLRKQLNGALEAQKANEQNAQKKAEKDEKRRFGEVLDQKVAEVRGVTESILDEYLGELDNNTDETKRYRSEVRHFWRELRTAIANQDAGPDEIDLASIREQLSNGLAGTVTTNNATVAKNNFVAVRESAELVAADGLRPGQSLYGYSPDQTEALKCVVRPNTQAMAAFFEFVTNLGPTAISAPTELSDEPGSFDADKVGSYVIEFRTLCGPVQLVVPAPGDLTERIENMGELVSTKTDLISARSSPDKNVPALRRDHERERVSVSYPEVFSAAQEAAQLDATSEATLR